MASIYNRFANEVRGLQPFLKTRLPNWNPGGEGSAMHSEVTLVTVLPTISIVRGMVQVVHANGRQLALHPHDFLMFLKNGERVMAEFMAKQTERPARLKRGH